MKLNSMQPTTALAAGLLVTTARMACMVVVVVLPIPVVGFSPFLRITTKEARLRYSSFSWNLQANVISEAIMASILESSNSNSNSNSNSKNKNKNNYDDDDDDGTDSPQEASPVRRMGRSERKALERAKKAAAAAAASSTTSTTRSRRKHNFKDRKDQLMTKPGEGPLSLHSTVLPELNQQSSPEHVLRAIKRAQNLHDRHDLQAISIFLLEHTDDSFAYGYKGSLLSRLAVAALHLEHHDIAAAAIQCRRIQFRSSVQPMESAAIVRNLLRIHNVTEAWEILEDELSLPLEGTPLNSAQNRDKLYHRASALASIASRHFFQGEPQPAVHACNKLASMGTILHKAGMKGEQVPLPWPRLLQGANRCQAMLRNATISLLQQHDNTMDDTTTTTAKPTQLSSARQQQQQQQHKNPQQKHIDETHIPCNVVYSVLNAMIALPSENDNRAYEQLSNALVRRVEFVTGAIDMKGCPPADRGEAVFIGRSNVGKSSLVNMITNRKSLAYTSKRPGKTRQFNFYAVNDKPGLEKAIRYGDQVPGEKDADSFYLVDVPGFGYAKVPEAQRREWSSFLTEYITTRSTLRVLFHLLDSRLGPTKEDCSIMKQVQEHLPEHVRYVIVLTKADKNVKGTETASGKVSNTVLQKVHRAMHDNLGSVGDTVPVVLTSAESKLGRDEVWRYLCRAAAAAAAAAI